MSLRERADELGIRYFLISFSDLFGTMRSKLVPASAIDSVCETGAGFAGFATWLDMTPADPDLFAIPDVETLIQLPWKPEVGWLAADLVMDGQPVRQAPRSVLKQALQRARRSGFQMRTGVECEFFLVSPDGSSLADPRDGQPKPCYDQQALVRQYDLISEICDAMAALGWGPYQNDHEDANGQFEMNWQYADALVTADRQTFFKYMVKSLAEKHGMRATFMPKPFTGLTGNGCHLHVSLWDREQDSNLFLKTDDPRGLSGLAYNFLAGVLDSADALCAIVNPVVNSYRRIHAPRTSSGATWSPNSISYTGNNRTHMIRIPDPGRFELRLADGAANPYLMAASVLELGLEGIERKLDPGPGMNINAYETACAGLRELPRHLLDSLRALEQNSILVSRLGEEFVSAYVKLKRAEWDEQNAEVSQWERQRTLDC